MCRLLVHYVHALQYFVSRRVKRVTAAKAVHPQSFETMCTSRQPQSSMTTKSCILCSDENHQHVQVRGLLEGGIHEEEPKPFKMAKSVFQVRIIDQMIIMLIMMTIVLIVMIIMLIVMIIMLIKMIIMLIKMIIMLIKMIIMLII